MKLFKNHKEKLYAPQEFTEEVNLDISENEEHIALYYTPKTRRAFYDICDFYGRILSTGKVSGQNPTSIDLKLFKKGGYSLCIVDGEFFVRCHFELKGTASKQR